MDIDPKELAVVELFQDLPEDSLQRLAEGSEIVQVTAGQPVFNEGDPGDSVLVVRKGMVKIVRIADPGVTLLTVTPGRAFGELGVLNQAPRAASAISIDETELIKIPSATVEDALDQPGVARRILGRMALSLTLAREQVVVQNNALDIKVRERTEELRETQLEVIRRLGRAAEFRDDDTGIHITRMSRFCAALAAEAGISAAECEILLHAAPMHDIGKIGIPDSILLKKGKLEDEEFEVMKTHTTIGAELLAGSTAPVMVLAKEIALSHHEKWNGRGYPNGIAGADIPFMARIATICDVFDALISERPYKKAWDPDDALGLIEKEAGTSFDPHLAKVFVAMGDRVKEMLRQFSAAADLTDHHPGVIPDPAGVEA